MGSVYKARDLMLEKARDRHPYVALKVLRGQLIEGLPNAFIALQREAVRTRQLGHHNIVRVYDFGVDGDTHFITMELLQGRSLQSRLNDRPRGLTLKHSLFYLEQVCEGLAYAHSQRIVHSDLKPGNIFITNDDVVKILDFGIASPLRTIGQKGEDTAFDARKMGALSPTYASPQQFEQKDADLRDDVYSLACVTYQMLTGRLPFGEFMSPIARQRKLEMPPIGSLNQRQNQALSRAMHFERDKRTATVEEFFAGLNDGGAGRGSTWKSAVGLTAAALAVAGVALWQMQKPDDPDADIGKPTASVIAPPEVRQTQETTAETTAAAQSSSPGCKVSSVGPEFEAMLQRGLDAQMKYGVSSDDSEQARMLQEIRNIAGCLQPLSQRGIATMQSRAWLQDVSGIIAGSR